MQHLTCGKTAVADGRRNERKSEGDALPVLAKLQFVLLLLKWANKSGQSHHCGLHTKMV